MKAYAKINLKLNVLGKNENGYHELDMVNAKVDLFDEIKILKNEKDYNELIFKNSNLDPLKDKMVLDIAEYFQKKYKIPEKVKILIYKNIPVGAGLAGGSADAAEIIKYFNSQYNLNLGLDELIKIGVMFGADIPYCLTDDICHVKGVGEKISKYNEKYMYEKDVHIIVFPQIKVLTKDVFNNLNLNECNVNHDLFSNDLESSTFSLYPELKNVKENLLVLGFKKVVMSGSGSSFICICKQEEQDDILKKIKKYKYDVFVTHIIRGEK